MTIDPTTEPVISAPADTMADLAIGTAALEGYPVNQDVPEIDLVHPLPGFPHLTRFVLVRVGDEDGDAPGEEPDAAELVEPVLYELRSVEQPEVRFLVAVPTAFFPEYAFDLDESACSDLELRDAEDALVLVLLTIGDDAASTTANLLAPVVINARTRSAAQVILSGTDWPVRAAVV